MPTYRVYGKIYKNGKPQGGAFVSNKRLTASSASRARAIAQRSNNDWAKAPIIKRGHLTAKVVKVVPLTKKGRLPKTGRRRSSSLESQLRRLF